ncbi:hypothetical protein PR202_gb21611 [Eleusine coracana subsp. coracana]|uniref:DC1 domain-containing protein n=1 Tax=Eleusine coracana subsp. coracana TaxID=191504 RepID=A0AAV5FEF4_ELECO|nr:hypothetical protein PR202_gb21611 [Eleusine coracana subsp. coracana]
MCWEDLSGTAYGCCAGCNFCIHESCAIHQQTLSSPAHHAHQLVLVQTRHDDATLLCDICVGSCVPGSFLYRCPPCGFDMHPSCARLPEVVCSARHMEHHLKLVQSEGRCAACNWRCAIREWFYRCTVCDIDYHVSCAAGCGEDSHNSVRQQGGEGLEERLTSPPRYVHHPRSHPVSVNLAGQEPVSSSSPTNPQSLSEPYGHGNRRQCAISSVHNYAEKARELMELMKLREELDRVSIRASLATSMRSHKEVMDILSQM